MNSPVMNAAFGDKRKAMSSPTSSGRPTLPKLLAIGCVSFMLQFKKAAWASFVMPPFYDESWAQAVAEKILGIHDQKFSQ